jgi:hypothetical protein
MAYFAGLDVLVKETSVCIVDDNSLRRARERTFELNILPELEDTCTGALCVGKRGQSDCAEGQRKEGQSCGTLVLGPGIAVRIHSITSSARASSVGGTSRPSALAALRLITSSDDPCAAWRRALRDDDRRD